MSVYYKVLCDSCREKCYAASEIAGGWVCHMGDSHTCLPPFLAWHCGCALRVVSEFENAYDNDYTQWGDGSVRYLFGRKKPADKRG